MQNYCAIFALCAFFANFGNQLYSLFFLNNDCTKKEIKIINYYYKLIYSILKEIKKYCLKFKKFKNVELSGIEPPTS